MNTDQNGFGKAQVLEEVPQQPPSSRAPPSVNGHVPFVPSKDKPEVHLEREWPASVRRLVSCLC